MNDQTDHAAITAAMLEKQNSIGAMSGIIEGARLLRLRNMDDAAMALLQHAQSILTRVKAEFQASEAIAKAQK